MKFECMGLRICSNVIMNYREEEYVAMDKMLKEMKHNYEEVCRHRLKLEHDLQVATHEKSMLDTQLTETQVCCMDAIVGCTYSIYIIYKCNI